MKDYLFNSALYGVIEFFNETRTPHQIVEDFFNKQLIDHPEMIYEILDETVYGKTKHITQFHVQVGMIDKVIDEVDIIEQ